MRGKLRFIVERLAKRKGVVRKLLAAEALGSTTLVLTDKTAISVAPALIGTAPAIRLAYLHPHLIIRVRAWEAVIVGA